MRRQSEVRPGLLARLRARWQARRARARLASVHRDQEKGRVARAARRLAALAATGQVQAQYELACLYESGRGVVHNPVDAAAWHRRAADQGHAAAAARLAKLLSTGGTAERGSARLTALFRHGRALPRDPQAARHYAMVAAEAGDVEGQTLAAYFHAAGIGGPVDMAVAQRLYAPAAQAGNAEAALGMGTLLAGGHVGSADFAASRLWFMKAADAGNLTAITSLASDFTQGLGGPADPQRGAALFEKAAARGHAPALRALGILTLSGHGTRPDRVRAETFLRGAAAQGDVEACARLGDLTAAESVSEAAEWYRRAGEQGHKRAQRALADCYKAGRGVPRDPVQAMAWLRRAADGGDRDAQFALGVAYAVGDGVERDFAFALTWSKAAAEAGHPTAKVNLGRFRMQGVGGDRDPADAMKWLQAAIRDGERAAFATLGELFAFWSDPPDLQQARTLFEQAARMGDPRGAELLKKLGEDAIAEVPSGARK